MDTKLVSDGVFLKNFGCQMNVAELQQVADFFLSSGFFMSEDLDKSSIIVINTCTVREKSEHKLFSFLGYLKSWKLVHAQRKVIVIGCAAERTEKFLKTKFPQVDLVVGAKSISNFPGKVSELLQFNVDTNINTFDWNLENNTSFPKEMNAYSFNDAKDISYITIMRGCNYSCSYCIVPFVKGRETYRPLHHILEEIKYRTTVSSSHVCLLGQTVNSYHYLDASIHPNKQYNFLDLYQEVEKIPTVKKISFVSAHPYYMTDDLIQVFHHSKKLSSAIHLPVQSGSDAILKKMRRNYTRDRFLDIVKKFYNSIDNIRLTTDIIVGFPSETEEDFEKTLSLVRLGYFHSAFCFMYSSRSGTESAKCFVDDVSTEIKKKRLQKLFEVLKESSPDYKHI